MGTRRPHHPITGQDCHFGRVSFALHALHSELLEADSGSELLAIAHCARSAPMVTFASARHKICTTWCCTTWQHSTDGHLPALRLHQSRSTLNPSCASSKAVCNHVCRGLQRAACQTMKASIAAAEPTRGRGAPWSMSARGPRVTPASQRPYRGD